MRIEAVEIRHLRMRLRSPFVTSFGTEFDRDCLVLRVYADGLVGLGECVADQVPGYSYETTGTAWHVLGDFLLPAVLGVDFADLDAFLGVLKPYRGHNLARAALEMAFWDLMAKDQQKPLAALLGGERQRVPVGVSVGIQPDHASLLQTVEGYLADGYRRVKLKIKPGRDTADVAAVRAAFPDLALQVDANSAYTLADRPVFEALDHQDLLLIEQPLAEDDLIDHAALQQGLQTALCLDESITSLRHARQALQIEACRIINIKQARTGGLRESLLVHNLCQEAGVAVWCGGMLETGVGRAVNLALASLPNFLLPGDISASDRYYAVDIAEPRFTLNPDSTIDVPQLPGIGVEIDEAALEAVTLRREIYKA